MGRFIFPALLMLSSLNAPAPLVVIESRRELVIPRARILLHRWLEPSYQVRMLASFDWTAVHEGSTIF